MKPASHVDGGRLEELLSEVADGRHEAFAEMYTAVAPAVFELVHGVLGDDARAEEVCQEVLVEVWLGAASFDAGRGPAVTWIMTLAHRRAVCEARAVHRARDRELRAASLQHVTTFDEVSESVQQHLQYAAVRRCLAGLTPRQRESLVLAYYGGWTYPEVAKRLGVALGTVKTRIRDGLLRLRACLASGGAESARKTGRHPDGPSR